MKTSCLFLVKHLKKKRGRKFKYYSLLWSDNCDKLQFFNSSCLHIFLPKHLCFLKALIGEIEKQ